MSTPLVAPCIPLDDLVAPTCPRCEDTEVVEHWARHDGRDDPSKKGHYEVREVPCPDCKHKRLS